LGFVRFGDEKLLSDSREKRVRERRRDGHEREPRAWYRRSVRERKGKGDRLVEPEIELMKDVGRRRGNEQRRNETRRTNKGKK